MRGFVTEIVPPTPPQTVVLEMTVEEFALLNTLAFVGLSGGARLRYNFAAGLAMAAGQLNHANAVRVEAALQEHRSKRGWISEDVARSLGVK